MVEGEKIWENRLILAEILKNTTTKKLPRYIPFLNSHVFVLNGR